jgi:glutaredoxin
MGEKKILIGLLAAVLCVSLTDAFAAGPRAPTPDEMPAGKKLYKWVDREGNVTYHDQPPPAGSGYRVEEKPIATGEKPKKINPNAKVAEKFPVILYSALKCESCDLARTYLEKRKIPFTEKNVESDLKLQEELKKKIGALSVPTILVGEKVMRGYLESLLEGELDAVGYAKLETPETSTGKPRDTTGDTAK